MGIKIKNIFVILIFLIFTIITPLATAEDAQDIVRVGLTDQKFQNVLKQEITVYGTNECDICDKLTHKIIMRIGANTDIIIKNVPQGLSVTTKNSTENLRDFVIVCPSGLLGIRNLTRKSKPALYHGAFEFSQNTKQSGFYLINIVAIEDYLKGVVPNEMPVSFGLEALKAQAVAARNYVLSSRPKANENYNVVDSVASQVYYGANTEDDLSTRAVMETDGIVALYNNELILALYSSTAGGYTESYSNAFSDPLTKMFPSINKPYLKAVPDKCEFEVLSSEEKAEEFYKQKIPSYDINSPYYRWQKTWTVSELEKVLKTTLITQSKTGFVSPLFKDGDILGDLKDIKVMKRGQSGKIVELDLMTTKGCYKISKEIVIRRIFQKDGISLPSANVVFEKELDNYGNIVNITAYGGGFGHGVGMSQYGAGYMAQKLKQPYYNILRHYYSGISLGTKPVVITDKAVKQKFWAPIGRAQIVVIGQVPYIRIKLNGKQYNFSVQKQLFQKETKIDISRYIDDYENIIEFEPTIIPVKVYIELVEKYNLTNEADVKNDK